MFRRLAEHVGSRYRSWRYRRYARNAIVPELVEGRENKQERLRKEGYFSQEGQDKWVYETIFNKVNEGVFVDIGAHDGVHFSNTLFLESVGWNGILVEPNPEVYSKLMHNRRAIAVNACISSIDGSVTYRKISGWAQMLSGIVEYYDQRHLARIERDLSIHGGSYEDIQIRSIRLDALLEEHKIGRVDYMNIDVEGAELAILKTLNFHDVEISVIGVENNYKDYRIPAYMASQGYIMHSIAGDEFYVKRQGAGSRFV